MVAARDATIAEQARTIAELKALVEKLTAQVAKLEDRLGQNSRNSSKPPSSDSPDVRRPPRTPTGRRPGGQPGHKKRERDLLPTDQVDETEPLVPSRCDACEADLTGATTVGEPERFQVVEIPPITPHVKEFHLHTVACTCGAVTKAKLPPEVRGVFGPRLGAVVSLLTGKYRLSKRMAQDALRDLLGVQLCLGSVSKLEQEASDALAPPCEEALTYVQEQPDANADETGWREGRIEGHAIRAWLWVLATPLVAVFRVSTSRGSEVIKGLLKGFAGYLTTDRWNAYNWYELIKRQLCWSHITRDVQGFIDRKGVGGRIGEALMVERNRMFKWWHQVRDGTLERAVFQKRMKRVRGRVRRLLRDAQVRAEAKTRGVAKEILKLEPALWTFVDVVGIEPTNNFGERIIRHAVMWRKICFGTQSPAGSRFVERILTTVMTLRLQKRNVLEFLTASIQAHRTGAQPPSLLPHAPQAQLSKAA
jgi:transposase